MYLTCTRVETIHLFWSSFLLANRGVSGRITSTYPALKCLVTKPFQLQMPLNQNTQTKPTETSQVAPRKKQTNSKSHFVLRHDGFIQTILQRAMSPSTSIGTLLDLCCHQLQLSAQVHSKPCKLPFPMVHAMVIKVKPLSRMPLKHCHMRPELTSW